MVVVVDAPVNLVDDLFCGELSGWPDLFFEPASEAFDRRIIRAAGSPAHRLVDSKLFQFLAVCQSSVVDSLIRAGVDIGGQLVVFQLVVSV